MKDFLFQNPIPFSDRYNTTNFKKGIKNTFGNDFRCLLAFFIGLTIPSLLFFLGTLWYISIGHLWLIIISFAITSSICLIIYAISDLYRMLNRIAADKPNSFEKAFNSKSK